MKRKIYLSISIILLGLFFLFTAIVHCVDVQPIGPNESKVGLATINGAVANAITPNQELNQLWYNISEYAGYISILVMAGFAVFGLYQSIKRKSLFKIDRHIYVLGGFYAVLLLAYLAFEVIVINQRPVLIDGELEASYPSSHTMLAVGVMTTAIFELHELINKKPILIIGDCLCAIIGLVIVICRIASGVHWITDIIAGTLLASTLICVYRYVVLLTQKKKERQ